MCVEVRMCVCGGEEVRVCEGVCVLCGCRYKMLGKSDIPRQFVKWLLVAPHMDTHTASVWPGNMTSKLF